MWGAGTGASLGFLNTLTAPVRSAANQFLRNQAAAAIRKSGLNTLRTARTAPPLQGYLATLKLSANTPVFKGTAAVLTPPVAANVSNKTGFTEKLEGALNQVGPALDRLFSGTPEVIQQYGREQEKKGWGGAFETASYLMGPGIAGSIVTPTVASLTAPFLPNTKPAPVATTPPRRPIANLPADYKRTELEAGAAAEAFRPGAGFPGQQQFPGAPVDPLSRLSPQDRAYQQERARVEAMVKSNPDMKKQEIAEARAKVRDKGMEEWAKANPELAAKVMPGQSGFSAIQGFVGGVGAPTTGPASATPQASPELNPASPTFAGGEGAPILRDLTPELIKQYQEQLLKQAK
jgi:hypothetical protein